MKTRWEFRRPDGSLYWSSTGSRRHAIAELLDYLRLRLLRKKTYERRGSHEVQRPHRGLDQR